MQNVNKQLGNVSIIHRCSYYKHIQNRARTHAVLVIGLYELLDPATQLIEPPGSPILSPRFLCRLTALKILL